MDEGSRRVGSLLLRWSEDAPRPGKRDLAVDLAPAADRMAAWIADGGLLAAQALHPVAGLPPEQRRGLRLTAAGPAAALAGLVAAAIGFARIAAALHPDDREAFSAAMERIGGGAEVAVVDRMADLPTDHANDYAFLGCGGTPPRPDLLGPLVHRLRPEGQLVLFGLPRAAMRASFDDFSARGLSLRAAGIDGDFAFLAGSLDHGHRIGA
ncbi:MAG: hypothetical protein D6702_07945 [Planctomycetota bacterium]|nr:MAG: hypothetical protein D6702_07945 [Planctomycetota bacterium]